MRTTMTMACVVTTTLKTATGTALVLRLLLKVHSNCQSIMYVSQVCRSKHASGNVLEELRS